MAKAPPPKNKAAAAAETPEKPKSKGKLLLVIFLIVLLLVVLVAGGLFALLMLKRGAGGEADGASAESASAVPTIDLSRPPTFVQLDPFTRNLAHGEGDRYIQVVVALQVADARTGENLKGFMPAIRHRINLLLSGKLPSEVSNVVGQEQLATEIRDEINQVLGAPAGATSPVQAVMFNSFIIQ